jgi:hypothetical protein
MELPVVGRFVVPFFIAPPPPAVPLLAAGSACANASVLDKAKAVAIAMVLILIIASFWYLPPNRKCAEKDLVPSHPSHRLITE